MWEGGGCGVEQLFLQSTVHEIWLYAVIWEQYVLYLLPAV